MIVRKGATTLRLLACACVCFTPLLASGSGEAAQAQPLRVAVYDVPPYGYQEPDGSFAGVSVDLWRRVAEKMERDFELKPVSSMEVLLQGLEKNQYDVAIGAITITTEREERVEFTYPAHRSGVAVAIRKTTGPLSSLVAYAGVVSDLSVLIGVILTSLLVAGLAMWAIERPRQSSTSGESAIVNLRDGLYWAVVTMTTVGYGDKTPKTTSGRIMATLWMFGSLVLISLLSTTLVARMTADRVKQGEMASSSKLSGKKLAAVAQSSGAEYLDEQHRDYLPCKDLPAALDALSDGRVEAVVNSIGALRYAVSVHHVDGLEVLQGVLAPAYMAMALPQHSPLKKPIDRALITITSGPEWTSLENRYFDR